MKQTRDLSAEIECSNTQRRHHSKPDLNINNRQQPVQWCQQGESKHALRTQ